MIGRSLWRWTLVASMVAAASLVWVSASGLLPREAASMAAAPVASGLPAQPDTSQLRSSGSAFAIGPGLLVTNSHVVLHCDATQRPVVVVGYAGPWRVVQEDRDLDLALLRGPDQPAIPALPLSAASQVPHDALALVLGYPVDDRGDDAAAPHAAMGAVRQAAIMVHRPETGVATSFRATDRAGHDVDPTWQDGVAFFGASQAERMRWALEIAVRIGHGASGGPVVDRSGSVVGVVVADGTGDGLTSAITLPDLTEFLASAGVVATFASGWPERQTDWSQIYRLVSPSVLRIGC